MSRESGAAGGRAAGAASAAGPQHTFVVPAYGRSPHLEACLQSLAGQTAPGRVVVATSTPFDGLDATCRAFGARLVVHGPNGGIGRDWNAALDAAETPLVTIAHQDDVYDARFVAALLDAHSRAPGSAMYFCDAGEISESGERRASGSNARVKRLMVALAFLGRRSIAGPLARRMLFGFGNPVVCPAVSINRAVAPGFRFREDLRTNMDWLAWLDLSAAGRVTRVPGQLMDHRVHTSSETARCLDDGSRAREDLMVFRALWPEPVAVLLGRLYRRSYQGYI
ncbi:glycosyltransferase family 2 protein [Cognatilysobacter segetis]|uniref:glycosyltransferase family 2 protein n=1 Tax=Cognatilysobacter segetis TaxID=2492394 RepID=UPI00138FF518|nr:glycosyltransferase family 2 protein [Lysobacter segetis]